MVHLLEAWTTLGRQRQSNNSMETKILIRSVQLLVLTLLLYAIRRIVEVFSPCDESFLDSKSIFGILVDSKRFVRIGGTILNRPMG
jgi:hypothetical protein